MKPARPLLLIAAALAACVSLDETPMTRGSVQPRQRTVVLIFAPPTPFFSEIDSKAETAAKIVPGLGLVVADAQSERDVRQSKGIHQYLPEWNAAERFEPKLLKELELSGWPGRFLGAAEAELPGGELAKLNGAADMADWRERYFYGGASHGVQRNYSRFLTLDDALVLEANLAPGVVSDGEGEITPNLSLSVRVFRANTMRQLWRHELAVDDPGAKRTLYEYKSNPTWLLGAWENLMPALAQKMTDVLRKNLQAASMFVMPTGVVLPLGFDSGASTMTAVAISTPPAAIQAVSVSSAPPPAPPPKDEKTIR